MIIFNGFVWRKIVTFYFMTVAIFLFISHSKIDGIYAEMFIILLSNFILNQHSSFNALHTS